MRDGHRTKRIPWYLVLVVIFLLIVTISLGYLLMKQSKSSIYFVDADEDAGYFEHGRSDD